MGIWVSPAARVRIGFHCLGASLRIGEALHSVTRRRSTAVIQRVIGRLAAACLCERQWPVLLPETGVNRYTLQ